VAQYADACNLFSGMGMDALGHKLDVLKQHCENVGRDYAEIEKTILAGAYLAQGKMTVSDVIEQCQALAKLGVQHAIFNMPNVQEITPLEVFGREIIPAVAEL
jgi:hypothetical protein